MCPMCISMATWLVVGSVSTGSAVTLGFNYWRRVSDQTADQNNLAIKQPRSS